jgi:hypothetical protein
VLSATEWDNRKYVEGRLLAYYGVQRLPRGGWRRDQYFVRKPGESRPFMATVFNVDELVRTSAIDKAALRVGPATGGPPRAWPLPPGGYNVAAAAAAAAAAY